MASSTTWWEGCSEAGRREPAACAAVRGRRDGPGGQGGRPRRARRPALEGRARRRGLLLGGQGAEQEGRRDPGAARARQGSRQDGREEGGRLREGGVRRLGLDPAEGCERAHTRREDPEGP